MKNDEFKKQVEYILKEIDAGKKVTLNLKKGENTAKLTVGKDGAKKFKPPTDPNAALDVGKSPVPMASLNFDSAPSISDEEIVQKIRNAGSSTHVMPLAASATLPKVVLTRDDQRKVWILFDDCSYQPDKIEPTCTITAPKNFEFDLASIPRVFWSILDPPELSLAAPLFHDLIYRVGGVLPTGQLTPDGALIFTRAEVDALFLELMTKAGIPRWKRQAAYLAVRGFAGFAWKK